jgi:aminoglycoside phosphotransferase (APT) family kinase protein
MNDIDSRIIKSVIQKHFGEAPTQITRMTIGTANEVYRVALANKEVVARLSPSDKFLYGSHNHIPIFKRLGIKVPDILAEDSSKTFVPYNYQVLSKIDGQDLGEIFFSLNNDQLKNIAKQIAVIFKKVKTIPADGKFGYIYAHKDDLVNSWTELMQIAVVEAVTRGKQTKVMEDWMEKLLEKTFNENKPYFDQVKSETYFDDISSKNVMIYNGTFSGLVDLDCLAEGDYLEAIGRIKASWAGTQSGEIYTNAVMDELNLNDKQRAMVNVYAIFNRIYWTCENGILMNQNTKPEVDWDKDKENKKIVKILANEK